MAADFVLIWKIPEILVLLLARIPEGFLPYLIEREIHGDGGSVHRAYDQLVWGVRVVALALGAAYVFAGAGVIRLWVGPDFAPASSWAFVAAGGGLMWLAWARVQMVFAYGLAQLHLVNRLLLTEVVAKIILSIVLIPYLGPMAPVVAINILHAGGMAWVYSRLGRAAVNGASGKPELGTKAP